jgi:predicted TIM-barrel fold metal-dependent hydrolase
VASSTAGSSSSRELSIPRIISVDDHVLEPPDVWSNRLPSKYQDRGPRIKRQKLLQVDDGSELGNFNKLQRAPWIEDPTGTWADVWYYDDLVTPIFRANAVVRPASEGRQRIADLTPTTYDELHKGAWFQPARLADMDLNHVEASICFPGTLPRFCGQAFCEREDKDLALLCVQAYNDWMIDEWCGAEGHGRLIPLTIVPLWDSKLAAEEIRRCANKGSFAVSFSENPHPLGLPSLNDKDRFWDPFFAACQETDTVVSMHFGSSSRTPVTSPDMPALVGSALLFQNAMGSLLEFIFSGILERFPRLKISFAECQVGWMPYILERADKLWAQRGDTALGSTLKSAPSSFIPGRVYGCIFDDETGLLLRDRIGMSQICFETDYPHSDGTFPDSLEILSTLCTDAGLSDHESYQLARGNAIEAYGLQRVGITS